MLLLSGGGCEEDTSKADEAEESEEEEWALSVMLLPAVLLRRRGVLCVKIRVSKISMLATVCPRVCICAVPLAQSCARVSNTNHLLIGVQGSKHFLMTETQMVNN